MSSNVINPYQTFFDSTGKPRSGGFVTFFVNTTTIKAPIFSDEALTVAQTNPYELDAHGRITGDVKYSGLMTLQVANSDLSDVITTDDVTTIETSSSLRSDLAASSGSSLVGFIQSGAAAVPRTVQDKDLDIVSDFDFMSNAEKADIRAGTAAVDVSAAIIAAHAALAALPNGGELLLTSGTRKIGSDVTINSNVSLNFHTGARISVDATKSLVINGPIKAGADHIFTGDGTVTGEMDEVFLEWFGAKAAPFDSTAEINAALNFKAGDLRVKAGGANDYFATDKITITGGSKVLDLSGTNIVFTFNNKVGIEITSATVTKYSGIQNGDLWFDTCTGLSNVGIQIYGKARFVDNRNITVNYVGLGLAGGVGYEIIGGTAGDTPFFGSHKSITCNQCYSGFYIHGINGDLSSDVTTQIFDNPYAATCNIFGMKFAHASNNTIINRSIESTTVDGIIEDDCSRNEFIGGITEGSGGADRVSLNRRTATNLDLSQSNFGTLDITKYENLPDVYFDDQLYVKRMGMPLVALANTGIIQFVGIRGVLTVQTRRGGWARFLLSTTTDTATKQVTILEQFVSGDTWTTAKSSAGLNVYWNSGASKWELENLSTVGQTVSCQLVGE